MKNQTGLRLSPFLLGACALLFLMFRYGPYFQNGSPDYVLHFTLIDEIMRSGGVAANAADRISVMAFYPPVSHWMAALIGWIGGSGLVGISLVTVGATFFTYLIAARIVADTPIRLALFLGAFLLIQRTQSLVGWEVVLNFFYPQLVGDAFYFFALLCLVKVERLSYRSAIFIIMGTLTMWVQPLNAIHIMATGCFLLALELLRLWRDRRAFPLQGAVAAGVVVLLTLGILVSHPEFKLMRQISSNNGALEFAYSMTLVVFICVVICALNAWRYVCRNAEKADLVLGAAGLAACSLVVLQYLAWSLHGDGSPYAVKKHMYIVVTIGMMNAVRLLAALIDRPSMRNRLLVDCATPLLAAYMATWVLRAFTEPLAPTVRAFEQAKELATYQFKQLTSENAVFYDKSLPLISNALISRVVFNHPLDYRWWSGMKITDGVQYAVVPRVPFGKNCSPNYAWSSEYVAVDSACLMQYQPGDVVSFSSSGNGRVLLGHGWYGTEPWGTWATDDAEIQITIPKNRKIPNQLDVDAMAYISPPHDRQQIIVEVNGTKIAEWDFTSASPQGPRTATIPADLIKDGSFKIVFRAPGAVSPSQLSASADHRVFGIGLKTLTLRDAPVPSSDTSGG
jgi:hypothetical protein